jgi:hypothetical protein
MSLEIKPIFIIGKHRSGTTGLANHLCEHSGIVGVQHKEHEGIHESAYFSRVRGRYGSLQSRSNFREFVEVMSASDYYQIAGISKEYMMSLWPTTYDVFFKSVMDEFSLRKNSTYWVEKSPEHTVQAFRLAEVYPKARFIAIIRNVQDVISSSLAYTPDHPVRKRHGRSLFIVKVVVLWAFYKKLIEELKRAFPDRTYLIRYEQFRKNKEAVLDQICSFLGVKFESQMTNLTYAPNTSFDHKSDRKRAVKGREEVLVRMLSMVCETVPLAIYRFVHSISNRFQKNDNLPDWFFRISDSLDPANSGERVIIDN